MSSISRPSTPTTSKSEISHPAHTLLIRAHSPTAATNIFTDKLKHKPLLLHPSTTKPEDKRSLRRHIRLRKKQYHLQHQRPRPLSAKEKRTLHVHDLQPHEINYSIYQNLNQLWTGYILEVLNLTDSSTGNVTPEALDGRRTISAASQGSLLASADYHGMAIEVVRAKDVGRVGLKGIVVRDTRSTFLVVTEDDRCVRVMKSGCVFRITIDLHAYANTLQQKKKTEPLPDENTKTEDEGVMTKDDTLRSDRKIVFDLHGSQLEIRPAERAVRKFKWKNMEYL